jgi:hypothetical protein
MKTQPMTFQQLMLMQLQTKHVYAGTVPKHVIAARRRRNKAARIARRANRH